MFPEPEAYGGGRSGFDGHSTAMVELSSRAADARHVDTYAIEITVRVVLQGTRSVGVGGDPAPGSLNNWR